MRLIFHYMNQYKKYLFLNLVGVCSFALVELGIPTILAQMINNGVMTGDRNYIYKMGLLLLLVAVAGALGSILLGYCSAQISTAITRDIRNDVFRKVQSFSPSEMNQFGVSSLIIRTNNDAFQIQMFVNVLLRTAMLTPMMILFSFTLTFATSVRLSMVILATLPVILLGVLWVTRIAEPISQKQQEKLDEMNRISRENLTGIRVIRAFNNDSYEQKRFQASNDGYAGYSKKVFRLMMLTQPVFFFLMNLAILVIFWIAGNLIQAGSLQVGDLVAFQDYVFHAMFSTMLFCTVLVMYPKTAVSARRIREVLDTESIIKDQASVVGCNEEIKGEKESGLEFDHVTFVYPDGEEAVLKDVSFQVRPGETIAFIGSTGSGKLTRISATSCTSIRARARRAGLWRKSREYPERS